MLLNFVRSSAVEVISAENVQLIRDADSIQLRMQLHFPDTKVGRNDIWLLVPRLVNGQDSLDLPSVGVYGRTPYYYAVRSGQRLFQGDDDVMLRSRDIRRRGAVIFYSRALRHRAWVDSAEVKLIFMRITCCGNIMEASDWRILEQQHVTLPDTYVQRPIVKQEHGTAHVDFVLDSIWIDPNYHDNRRELGKISHLIDSLQADPEIHIDTVTLHGYASPEGPYKHNVWLAKNRVKALAGYIANRHSLDPRIISQQSTPEDWAGLRRYVEASKLPHRSEILEVIDDTVKRPDPDRRLRYIRRTYVEDFADIFDNNLPYLRHTDYTIRYTTGGYVTERIPGVVGIGLPNGRLVTPTPPEAFPPLRPLFAVKTNLLFDAILWPNIEIEVPFGRNAQWSALVEWGSPWYVWNRNQRCYQILNLGVEMRRWLGKCPDCRPVLTGGFLGLYGAAGKYDLEWNGDGNQGEYGSAGISGGYSWLLSKNLNLELSASVGVLFGKQRHYTAQFQNTHLIWSNFDNLLYVGPTQLKLSIVWLIPRKWFGMKE